MEQHAATTVYQNQIVIQSDHHYLDLRGRLGFSGWAASASGSDFRVFLGFCSSSVSATESFGCFGSFGFLGGLAPVASLLSKNFFKFLARLVDEYCT